VSELSPGKKPRKFWQNPWLRAVFVVIMGFSLWAAWPNFENFGQVSQDRKLAIVEVKLKRDFSYYWLEIECLTPQGGLDCSGWYLSTQEQQRIEQAKGRATIESKQSLRFYIPKEQLEQTLILKTAHGELQIKARKGLPQLENSAEQSFHNPQWP